MNQSLKAYLHDVVNMEKRIYLQEKLLQFLNEERSALNQVINSTQPALKLRETDCAHNSLFVIIYAIVGCPVCGFSAYFVQIAGYWLCNYGNDGLNHYVGIMSALLFILAGLLGILLVIASMFLALSALGCVLMFFCVPLFLVFDIKTAFSNHKTEKENRDIEAEWRQNTRAHQQDVAEAIARKRRLDREASKLEENLQQSRNYLENLYQRNIIFPKYRYFVAVASFYEYISSGRSQSLELRLGDKGCYNIYEEEIDRKIIISQLNMVLSNLSSIRNGQYVLYTAIQDAEQQYNAQIQVWKSGMQAGFL